jgi:ABC-type transport system substrate-binding protein
VISRRAVMQAAAVAPLLSLRTARADESGTLTVALSNNPVTCDPINMSSHDTELLSQTIWENLVEFDITAAASCGRSRTRPLTKFIGIWPKGSRDRYGDDYFRLTPKAVGTGRGIFDEWVPNDYVSFRRNPNYWQKGLPHWDRLVVKIVSEDATRVACLLTGQVDIIGAPPARDFTKLRTRKVSIGKHGRRSAVGP